LEEIKTKYGRRTVKVEFDGDGEFIATLPQAASVRLFPRWAELELKPGIETNELLRVLLERVSIQKFEISAPSLHSIFVRELGKAKDKGGDGNE
jgi:ABC-type uncharacterized transport system ATPase subunit